ncbi:unnamed protein product [Schistocephalus solidus]|uniref:RING-type domain-containing protein n=1 Tax=Schistocephalus solidus TaxID=70667 RepID=A0A183TIC2_SCHSO|nr:unnamed protein product [Schistocephalus solidus]
MPSGVSVASGSSTLSSQVDDCSEINSKIPYNPKKHLGPLLDNMLIPKEYDTPDSDSLCDPFEFPPDIPDGVTYGDLASHISNVVENITLHAASKVEGTPHPADQSCFNANGQPFDPPNIASPDSNPYSTPAKENSSLPQYVFRVLRRCSYSADPLSPLMLGDSGSHITTDNLKPSGGTVIENRVTPTCILQCNSSGLPKTFSKNPDKDSEKGLSYMRPHSRQNHIREEELPQDYTSYPSDGEDEFGDFATFSSALAPTAEQPSVDYGNTSQPENDDFADFSSFTGQQATEVHSSLTSRSLVDLEVMLAVAATEAGVWVVATPVFGGGAADDSFIHLELCLDVETVAIPQRVLQSTKDLYGFRDTVRYFVVDFDTARRRAAYVGDVIHGLQWGAVYGDVGNVIGRVGLWLLPYHRFLRINGQPKVGAAGGEERFLPPLSGGLLQLLEPTPIASKVNKAPSGRSASPTSASSSQSSQATTAPSPSPSHGHSTLVTTAQSAQGHPHISAPIPEFDWSASGLINPLTGSSFRHTFSPFFVTKPGVDLAFPLSRLF